MSTDLNKANVKHQLNYHIVPFAYGLNYDDAQSLLRSKCERNEWRIADLGDANLLKHINKLISDKENEVSTIGRRYIMDQKGRGIVGLKNKQDFAYTFSDNRGKEYSVRVNSIELYLFETQIGFVAFNFEYSNDIEDLINLNYKMKHLYMKEYKLSYLEKKSKEDPGVKKEIRVEDLIYNITSEINVKTFFENNEDDKVNKSSGEYKDYAKAHKSLVYNAVILDKPVDRISISNYLYRMRRVFKDTYKPAPAELQIENNPEILQLFENVYWGVSLEAMSYVGHFVEDENTNKFFDSDYIGRLANSYLYLYLIVLHMRYSLLYFSVLSSELPKDIKECIELEKSQDKNTLSISKLEEKIAFFKLRCVFRDVSNVTHQGILYELIWKAHNIEGLLEELNSEINALALRTRLRKDEEEKQEKVIKEARKKEKQLEEEEFKDKLTIITVLFTILSAIANVTKIAETIRKVFLEPKGSIEIWIFIVIVIIIISYFAYFFYAKDQKRKNFKMESK